MKKYLLALTLFLITTPALAASVQWDRFQSGAIRPQFILDTVFGNKFTATSTTAASTFPYASTTAISATTATTSNLFIATGACTGSNALQVSVSGLVNCGAVTGSSGTVTQVNTTYPVTGGPITTTGTVALAFGTTTSNTWAGTQTFTNAPTVSAFSSAGTVNNLASGALYSTPTSTVTIGTGLSSSGASTFDVIGGSALTISSSLGTSITPNELNTALSANSIPYSDSAGTLFRSVSTSTPALSSTFSYSGTLGSFVGGTSGTLSIANNGLTLAMFPTIAANTVIGNLTGSTATPTAFATSSLFTGTVGQAAYFASTGGLVGTSSLMISAGGQVSTLAVQPATTTTLVLDWGQTPNQVEYRIGTAATSLIITNATSSTYWGSRKLIQIWNPGTTAGALTITGAMFGTAYSQTTTANSGDLISCDVSHATSTATYVVLCTAGKASP